MPRVFFSCNVLTGIIASSFPLSFGGIISILLIRNIVQIHTHTMYIVEQNCININLFVVFSIICIIILYVHQLLTGVIQLLPGLTLTFLLFLLDKKPVKELSLKGQILLGLLFSVVLFVVSQFHLWRAHNT